MSEIQQEYKKLYAAETPNKTPITTFVTYKIKNSMSEEEEIIQALQTMNLKKAPGLSGINIDMLNGTKNQMTTNNNASNQKKHGTKL
jgi:hypothetical protein